MMKTISKRLGIFALIFMMVFQTVSPDLLNAFAQNGQKPGETGFPLGEVTFNSNWTVAGDSYVLFVKGLLTGDYLTLDKEVGNGSSVPNGVTTVAEFMEMYEGYNWKLEWGTLNEASYVTAEGWVTGDVYTLDEILTKKMMASFTFDITGEPATSEADTETPGTSGGTYIVYYDTTSDGEYNVTHINTVGTDPTLDPPVATQDGGEITTYTFIEWTYTLGQNGETITLEDAKAGDVLYAVPCFEETTPEPTPTPEATSTVDEYTLEIVANANTTEKWDVGENPSKKDLKKYAVDYETAGNDGITTKYTFTNQWVIEKIVGEDSETLTNLVALKKLKAGDVARVTAQYTSERQSYTVTVEGENDSTEVAVGKEPVLEAPEKEGSTFDGWTYEDSDRESVEDITKVPVGSEITAIPVYTVNKYTVIFKDGNGEEFSDKTLEYGEEIEAPEAPEKPATDEFTYEFAGWFQEDGTKLEEGTTATGDVTYTATYAETVNEYTVTFADGSNIITKTVKYGTEWAEVVIADPDKDGYTFTGWGTTPKTITEDITVTATYEVNQYEISYYLEGGKLNDSISTYTVETEDFTLDTPTKEGYTFLGWSEDESEAKKVVTIAKGSTGDKNFTAVWERNEYTVTFMGEDREIELKTQTTKDGKVEYLGDEPTKENTTEDGVDYGYEFKEWVDKDGDVVDLDKITEDITVYPSFEKTEIKYTVTFKDEDGTNLDQQETDGGKVDYKGDEPTKENTTEDGVDYTYTFKGWETEEGTPVDLDKITGNITVKPSFTTTTTDIYYVSFKPNNGDDVKEVTVETGKLPENPEDPYKMGVDEATGYTIEYSFIEWKYFNEDDIEIAKADLVNAKTGAKIIAVAQYEIDKLVQEVEPSETDGIFRIEVQKDNGDIDIQYSVKVGDSDRIDEILATPEKDGYTFVEWKFEYEHNDEEFPGIDAFKDDQNMEYAGKDVVAIASYTKNTTPDDTTTGGTTTTTPDDTTTSGTTTTTPDDTTTESETGDSSVVATAPQVTVVEPTVDSQDTTTTPEVDGDTQDDVDVEAEVEQEAGAQDVVTGSDDVIIEDEDVALAAELSSGKSWALLNLILAIATTAASIILLVGYFSNKKKEEEAEKDQRNKGLAKLMSMIPAITAVVVFILTENMLNPMVITDKWTLLMLAIALVQAVVVLVASYKKDDQETDTEVLA